MTVEAASDFGLVGRTSELGRLREVVADLAGGRGRSVWIEGEPGIGKSALLAAALDLARQAGCQVFHAQAHQAGEVFPLRALLDALQVHKRATDNDRIRIAGLLWGSGPTVAVTPVDAVAAAAESLVVLDERTCLARPMILALDDAQLADETSLAVWWRLHRTVHQLPLLLMAAARPLPAREALRGLRGDMTRPDALLLELDALSQGDETILPSSVAAAVSARIGYLTPRATQILQLASLLGSEFDVDNLAALADTTATGLLGAIEEALTAGVLAESAMRLQFRHPLIRQVLYEAMPAGLRAALHQHAGAALASTGASVDVVAEQLLAGPQAIHGWAVEWLATAASALTSRAPRSRSRCFAGSGTPGASVVPSGPSSTLS